MSLIVRYGAMRYNDRSSIGIVGAGPESEREQFYKKLEELNKTYRRKDFRNAQDYVFGAISIKSLMGDRVNPRNYFAQFAEFDFDAIKGNKRKNAETLERKLKYRFNDSARRHLLILRENTITELTPEMPFPDLQEREEILKYLSASLDEMIGLSKK
jgi:hypothetical protein